MPTFIQQVRILQALRSKQFALLWTGQTISSLGDGAFTTALAWEVLLLTGSATAMGIIVTAEMLPRLFFLLLGGVLADRLPRRLVMIWSDSGRAILILLIAVLGWLHVLQLWHLIGLSLLFGLAAAFFLPSYRAIPPQLVDRETLPSANALTSFSQQTSVLLGPLLGAGLVAVAGTISAFAFDGLTFIVSALCLFALHLPSSQLKTLLDTEEQNANEIAITPSLSPQQLIEDLHEGLRFVMKAKWFWIGLPIAALGNIFFSGPLEVALPKLVHDTYETGVWLLGVIGTSTAIGSILATLIVGQLSYMRHRGIIMYLAIVLASLAEILLGLPLRHVSAFIVACFASSGIGFGLGAFGIIWIVVMQEMVPSDKLGRVSSIDQLGAWCLLPVGYALTGIVTDHVGASNIFLIGGTVNVFLALIALSVKDIRKVQ